MASRKSQKYSKKNPFIITNTPFDDPVYSVFHTLTDSRQRNLYHMHTEAMLL